MAVLVTIKACQAALNTAEIRSHFHRCAQSMKLVLLGTAGYHPTDRRQTACLMLPELGVVLDAGTAMYRIGKYLTKPQLDIFLTHAHLDHVAGLTFLLDVLAERKMERVTIHAMPDKLEAIA